MTEEEEKEKNFKGFIKMYYGIHQKRGRRKIKQLLSEEKKKGISGELIITIMIIFILMYTFAMIIPDLKF